MGRSAPIFRGLAIAIPLLLVFAFLFMAADAVFAKLVTDLFDWQVDLSDPVERLFLTVLLAWFGAGLLGFVALRDAARDPDMTPTFPHRRRVGATEAVVVLVVLDLLFAAFVIIQAAYLFGGADTLAASGMTYSEYARRGFFELMTVAFLVAGLIVAMEFLIATRTRAYQAAAIVLVAPACRARILVPAPAPVPGGLRLDRASVLRPGRHHLARHRRACHGRRAGDRSHEVAPHVMVVLSHAVRVAFNVIGPVRFIAEQNVAGDPPLNSWPKAFSGLDVDYLSSLGTDADIVPGRGVPSLPEPERTETQAALERSATELEADTAGQAWQAWNLSREQARDLLVE
jgi:hypothetical protein